MTWALAFGSMLNPNFWSTPDRRADRLFAGGRFVEAAATYQDPFRRGVALYRAGNFKDAFEGLRQLALGRG